MFEQLTLHEAHARGLEASENCAYLAGPEFIPLATARLESFFQQRRTATAEEATDHCIAQGVRPYDLRCFGAIYRRLIARGVIRKIGDAPRKRGHGTRGGSVYALVE